MIQVTDCVRVGEYSEFVITCHAHNVSDMVDGEPCAFTVTWVAQRCVLLLLPLLLLMAMCIAVGTVSSMLWR